MRPAAIPIPASYRHALGVLGASYCYQTYFALDGAARGLLLKAYRRYEVRQRTSSTQRTLAASIASLQRVQVGLAGSDRRALSEIIETLRALRQSAAALEEWARTQRKADLRDFERRRLAAWARLRRLLR